MTSGRPILALDVDGVLIRGWPERKWHTNLLEDFGFHPELLEEHLFKPHWGEIIMGKRKMLPVLEALLADHDTDTKAQDVISYWFDDSSHLREEVLAAALEWREQTKGSVFLATNQEELRAKYLWDGLGLSQHFQGMHVSCELGVAKPHPEFFARADQSMKVEDRSDVLFIDDLLENVEGATAHGWRAVQATDPEDIVAVILNDR